MESCAEEDWKLCANDPQVQQLFDIVERTRIVDVAVFRDNAIHGQLSLGLVVTIDGVHTYICKMYPKDDRMCYEILEYRRQRGAVFESCSPIDVRVFTEVLMGISTAVKLASQTPRVAATVISYDGGITYKQVLEQADVEACIRHQGLRPHPVVVKKEEV